MKCHTPHVCTNQTFWSERVRPKKDNNLSNLYKKQVRTASNSFQVAVHERAGPLVPGPLTVVELEAGNDNGGGEEAVLLCVKCVCGEGGR